MRFTPRDYVSATVLAGSFRTSVALHVQLLLVPLFITVLWGYHPAVTSSFEITLRVRNTCQVVITFFIRC